MFRLRLRVRTRKTGAVMMARLAVLAIVLATAVPGSATTASTAAQADDGTVPVNDTFTTTGHTEPSGTATTDPGGTDSTDSTGLTFTVVPAPPSLTIAKRHAGTFIRGEDGVYTITVGNRTAAGPTNGTTVTVHDTLPAGLRAYKITGKGWHCTLATLTCTRSDVLPAGHRYPPVTLKVHVSCNARARVTNTATVTGGGDTTTHTATDPTTIRHHGHHGHHRRHDHCDRHDH
ncbi:DUF11 domain-containing protein [Streptomyces brasiliensis]|uniref:DUF11 domain-containing protein n=1 Tax=Streptomyces brasiliensis TaxID=1954 RepID=A0A917NTU2_9ACTN|nr:DUF11 domain-containing protein [Streptomyces brasiliensis]GGJ27586.1 hypothetical protein GCM10010121_043570 [Streptomyces brasiliensis]